MDEYTPATLAPVSAGQQINIDRPEVSPLVYTCAGDNDDLIDELMEEVAKKFSGPGCLAKAREAGEFVLQTDPGQSGGACYAYSSLAAFSAGIAEFSAEGHEVLEKIDGGRPSRPGLDFDVKEPLTEVEATIFSDAACDATRQTLEGLGAVGPELAMACYGYNLKEKTSLHLICTGVHLADGRQAKLFSKLVEKNLPERWKKSLDHIATPKGWGLRVPNCPKKKDHSRTLYQLSGEPEEPNFLLQDGATRRILPEIISEEAARVEAEPGSVVLNKSATELVKLISDEYPWFGPPKVLEEAPAGYSMLVARVQRTRPHFCSSCDRNHDRQGAYITQTEEGAAFLRCDADSAKKAKVLASRGCNIPDLPLDGYDILRTNVERVCGQYNSDAIAYTSDRDLYVGSSWGTGKSRHNKMIVEINRDLYPDKPVLVVSCRKSLTTQMCKDLGAKSYTKITGLLNPTKCPLSVWQLESLKRVPSDTKFGLIICDELSALTAHAYDKEDNSDARAGMSTLRELLARAERIVVSDNDLTDEQVAAIQTLRPGVPSRVVRNDYLTWKDATVRIWPGHKAKTHVETLLWERLNTQHAAREAGSDWNGTVVPCHSRKYAHAIADEARRRYGKELVKIYTKETCDLEKQKDFSDAGEAWEGKLVVIYTGTVSVGVSANISHFDTVIAFFSGNNAPASGSAQMLFRARQVKRFEISFDGGKVFGLPRTREAVLRWATQANHRDAIPDEFRHDRCPTISIPSASDPTALDKIVGGFEGRLWINSQVERHRSQSNFVGRLTAILERAGLVVTVAGKDTAAPEPTTVAPVSGEDLGPSREEIMVAQVEPAIERLLMDVDPERDRTAIEKAGDRTVTLARNFGVDARELTPEWIVAHEPLVEPYRRLARTVHKQARVGDLLKTSSEAEGCALTARVLASLGLDVATMVSGAEVTAEKLEEVATALGAEINQKALRLYNDNKSSRRKKAKSGFRSWCGVLGVPLDYLGLEFESTYKSESDQKRGRNPTGAKLVYKWDTLEISPIPPHPGGIKTPVLEWTTDDVYGAE